MEGAVVVVNGAAGEGGGQVLRTTLSLAMLTQQPVQIENIRANRSPRQGLLRQHLTALRAAAEVTQAKVEGAALHSRLVRFSPGKIRPGRYHFSVGSAGSTTLVLQTILPALMLADEASEVVVEGGTHSAKAPPFEFLQSAFLPLIQRMGPQVEVELERPGFFPAGGGRLVMRVHPSPSLSPLSLLEVGDRMPLRARVLLSSKPMGLGHREMLVLRTRLGLEWENTAVLDVSPSLSPGNSMHVFVPSAGVTEVFSAFGGPRSQPDALAGALVDEVEAHLSHGVPVGTHLADQLLLPMALAGSGAFRTPPLSLHATTNMQVIQRFLDVPMDVQPWGDRGAVTVQIGRAVTESTA